MKQFKGYYIGVGPNDFHSEQEIDATIKELSVRKMQHFIRLMNNCTDPDMIMAASIEAGKIAETLAKEYGMTWGEIEAAEVAA